MSKIKKRHILFAVLLLVLVVIIAIAVIHFAFKPLNSSITIDGLQTATEETDYILVKIDDTYFEIQGTPEFSTVFEFHTWQQQQHHTTGEPVLVLRFAEAWIVEFFSDGTVTAHNGYASRGTKEDAYYSIPSYITDELIAYINAHGVQHELGDGTIGTSTFHK
jgi:hypothetical protein